MRRIWSIFFILSIQLGILFAFTNTYANWYGLFLFQPSPGANYFIEGKYSNEGSENKIDLFARLLVNYSFEQNANPMQPSILTSGFSIYSSITNYFPTLFRYGIVGFDYNLWTKILGIRIGNSPSEVLFGFGGAVGLNLESVEIWVGNSNDASDFAKVDFYHYNKIYLLNLLGALRAYIEIPINLYKFPSLMYVFNYNILVTLYGPFLPNLNVVNVNSNNGFEKNYSAITHSVLIKVRF